MTVKLSGAEAASLLRGATESLRHEECRTCECFQAFVTQLEIDAAEDLAAITVRWKIDREAMHPCLGCEPCPPADAYARYLNTVRKRLC